MTTWATHIAQCAALPIIHDEEGTVLQQSKRRYYAIHGTRIRRFCHLLLGQPTLYVESNAKWKLGTPYQTKLQVSDVTLKEDSYGRADDWTKKAATYLGTKAVGPQKHCTNEGRSQLSNHGRKKLRSRRRFGP